MLHMLYDSISITMFILGVLALYCYCSKKLSLKDERRHAREIIRWQKQPEASNNADNLTDKLKKQDTVLHKYYTAILNTIYDKIC